MYRIYGDTRIIEEHWEAMEKWMTFLDQTNPDGRRRQRLGDSGKSPKLIKTIRGSGYVLVAEVRHES